MLAANLARSGARPANKAIMTTIMARRVGVRAISSQSTSNNSQYNNYSAAAIASLVTAGALVASNTERENYRVNNVAHMETSTCAGTFNRGEILLYLLSRHTARHAMLTPLQRQGVTEATPWSGTSHPSNRTYTLKSRLGARGTCTPSSLRP